MLQLGRNEDPRVRKRLRHSCVLEKRLDRNRRDVPAQPGRRSVTDRREHNDASNGLW